MTKKIFSIVAGLALVATCFVSSSFAAGEVDRLLVETDDTNVTALVPAAKGQGNIVRMRVLFLTEDNELGTLINGADVTAGTLTVESENWDDDIVLFGETFSEAIDTTDADGTDITVESGWVELAVYYPVAVNEAGTDELTITLSRGSTEFEATVDVTVGLPPANCYYISTGGVGTLPEVLTELTAANAPQDDNGAVKTAGQTVTVDVFAAFYNGSGYYYTTLLLPGTETVTLSGSSEYGSSEIDGGSVASAVATLTDGHYQTTFTIGDLSIPDTAGTFADLALAHSWGVTCTFGASNTTGTTVGYSSGDVNSDEQVQLTSGDVAISVADSEATALFKPAEVDTVRIVGLPLNQLVDTNGDATMANYAVDNTLVCGFGGVNLPFATYRGDTVISPADVWYLGGAATPPATQASSFKVDAGKAFGAIVGYDQFDNPAQIGAGISLSVGDPDADALNTAVVEMLDGSTIQGQSDNVFPITTTLGNTGIIPFVLDDVAGQVTDVYLDATENASLEDVIADIDTYSEGLTFSFDDYFNYVTMSARWDEQNSAVDIEGTVPGEGTKIQLSFLTDGGSTLQLGEEDATSFDSAIELAKDGEASEIAVFDQIVTGDILFGKAIGMSGAVGILPITATGVGYADAGDYPPTAVSARTPAGATVVLDAEESHDELLIQSVFSVTDGTGNSGDSLENQDAEAEVFLAADNGSASATAFPGASASVDGSNVEVSFDLAQITADADDAVVRVTAGSDSADLPISLKVVKTLTAAAAYVPVLEVDDTPVLIGFADHAGAVVYPVTQTGDTAGAEYGIEVEIELEEEEGTSTPADGDSTYLDQSTARTGTRDDIVVVNPEDEITLVNLGLTSDYGDVTVALDYTPDFEPPVVGDLTAVNCGFEIAMTDNKAVDTAATTVTVINASGQEITPLELTGFDNGTSGILTVTSDDMAAGTYSVTISAIDAAGNPATTVTKTVSVTGCEVVEPACLTVDPTFALPGDSDTVTITAEGTSFDATTTVEFSCSSITVGDVSVVSTTVVDVDITVAADAAAETCDVTVTTGEESITCADSFEITDATPVQSCSIDTTSIESGATADVVITVENIDIDNSTEVTLSGSDLTINSTTVDAAAGTITINVTAAEVTADATVTVSIAGVECGSITVTAPEEPTCTLTVSPSSVRSGILFPRVRVITITADGELSGTTVDFGTTDIRALVTLPAGGGLRVIAIVRPRATAGTYDVTVGDCTGEITIQ